MKILSNPLPLSSPFQSHRVTAQLFSYPFKGFGVIPSRDRGYPFKGQVNAWVTPSRGRGYPFKGYNSKDPVSKVPASSKVPAASSCLLAGLLSNKFLPNEWSVLQQWSCPLLHTSKGVPHE